MSNFFETLARSAAYTAPTAGSALFGTAGAAGGTVLAASVAQFGGDDSASSVQTRRIRALTTGGAITKWKRAMLSGNDVLALIERVLGDTRGEVTSIDARLARSTAELERLRQAEIGVLSVLARIRMREIEGSDELSAALDETGRRVKELLAQREGAEVAAAAELAAAEARRAVLEQERAAQSAVVAEAERAVDGRTRTISPTGSGNCRI